MTRTAGVLAWPGVSGWRTASGVTLRVKGRETDSGTVRRPGPGQGAAVPGPGSIIRVDEGWTNGHLRPGPMGSSQSGPGQAARGAAPPRRPGAVRRGGPFCFIGPPNGSK